MKPIPWIGLLLLACQLTVQAQSAEPLPFPPRYNPKWVVKFAPFSLFDPTNTIQFGLERLIGKRHSIHVEVGYGWEGISLWRNNQHARYTGIENWRGRAEWRYYWRGGLLGPYVALEGLYKQVTAQENGTIGVGCETGQCQYYQIFTRPISKYVWGGHLKVGRQFSLFNNERLVGDFYGGIGLRKNSVERVAQPDGLYYYPASGFTLFDPFSLNAYPIISLSYGLKIGYTF
ncbi:hypothetical protein GCM10028818_36880 [Spirosoma horti]